MSPVAVSPVIADTHTVIWTLSEPHLLSAAAKQALFEAENSGFPIYVSAITIVELRYLVEKNKITEADYQDILKIFASPVSALTLVPLDEQIADSIKQIPRSDVPDMPDRIIAATAYHLGLPLVTRDAKLRASSVITTIW